MTIDGPYFSMTQRLVKKDCYYDVIFLTSWQVLGKNKNPWFLCLEVGIDLPTPTNTIQGRGPTEVVSDQACTVADGQTTNPK